MAGRCETANRGYPAGRGGPECPQRGGQVVFLRNALVKCRNTGKT